MLGGICPVVMSSFSTQQGGGEKKHILKQMEGDVRGVGGCWWVRGRDLGLRCGGEKSKAGFLSHFLVKENFKHGERVKRNHLIWGNSGCP